MPPRDPTQILDTARRAALGYAQKTSATKVRQLLTASQVDLKRRLEGIPASDKSFTTVQMRATLKQIQAVLPRLKNGLTGTLTEGGAVVGEASATATLRYLDQAERAYKGVGGYGLGLNTAAVLDRAVSGANASVVRRIAEDPQHPGQPGVVQRYGANVLQHFEKTLQVGMVTGMSWDDMKAQLVQGSPFLQNAPEYWAERLLRTELMGAHNTAANVSLVEVDQQAGGRMLRILCATFDDRTGSDSYAVHGQIRRTDEPFDYWGGYQFMTPPNRPNDREIVVPHHIEWPIPDNLRPKTDAEVLERWLHEKRKGSPPARPRLTTVPLETIGRPQPGPAPQPPGPQPPQPGPGGQPQLPGGGGVGPQPGPGVAPPAGQYGLPQGFTSAEMLALMQREGGLDLSLLGIRQPPEAFQRLMGSLHPDIDMTVVQSDVHRTASRLRPQSVPVEDLIVARYEKPVASDLQALLDTTNKTLQRARAAVKPTAIRMPDGRVVVAQGADRVVADAIEAVAKRGRPGASETPIERRATTVGAKPTVQLRVIDAADFLKSQGLEPRVRGSGKVAQALRKHAETLQNPATAPSALREIAEAAGYTPRRIDQVEVSPTMDQRLAIMQAHGVCDWQGKIGVTQSVWKKHQVAMQQIAAGGDPRLGDLDSTRVVVHESVHGSSPGLRDSYAQGARVLEEAFTEAQARAIIDDTFGTRTLTSATGGHYQGYIDKLCILIAERRGIATTGANRLQDTRDKVMPELLKIARQIWTGKETFNNPLSYVRRFNELTGVGDNLDRAATTNQTLMKYGDY